MGVTRSDNHHGLIASAMLTTVDGFAEREVTLSADKGCDAQTFHRCVRGVERNDP